MAAIQMDDEKCIVIGGYCKNRIGVKDEFKIFNHLQEAEMDNVNEIGVKTNKNKTFINHQGLAYRKYNKTDDKRNEHKTFIHYQKLSNKDSPDIFGEDQAQMKDPRVDLYVNEARKREVELYSDRLDIENMKLRMLNDRKVCSSDKDLVLKQKQSILDSIEKVKFLKRLYFGQLARCDYEHLE
ncbi:11270_t:CDS:2, partial [Gigaspora margarita]